MAFGNRGRALGSVVAAVAAGVTVGRWLVKQPDPADVRAAQAITSSRNTACDKVATAVSWCTDVPRAIVTTGVIGAATLALTRDPRRAAVPVVATITASAMHVPSTMLVDRQRPNVPRLGTTQPTSSYPSGHVGAATAQAISLARLAGSLPNRRRRLARWACFAFPVTVAWSRLYTGQHFVTDVLAGCVNGVVAATAAPALVGANAPETNR